MQRYASQEAYDQALSADESAIASETMKVPVGDIWTIRHPNAPETTSDDNDNDDDAAVADEVLDFDENLADTAEEAIEAK